MLQQQTEQNPTDMSTLNTILGLPDDDQQQQQLQQQDAAQVQQPAQNGGGATTTQQTVQSVQQQPAPATQTLTQQDAAQAQPAQPQQPTHMSYAEMVQQLSPYKPPTEEEVKKERRKQKRDKVFAAIGDGLAAFNVAYANARGIKPIATVGLSGKVRERYERLKKERDAQSQEYLNAMMRGMQADDANARDDRNWRRTLERDAESDRRDQRDFDFRKQQADQQQSNWQATFDRQGEQWAKQFEESKRLFNVSSSQAQQRINMESRRLTQAMQQNEVTFALGTGNGTITVPTQALNASNVSYVFSKLPESVRSQVQGEPIYEGQGRRRTITGYKPITTEAMLVAIGANIESSPDAQAALREVAGQRQSGDNTPPSRRGSGNDDTPPSRR